LAEASARLLPIVLLLEALMGSLDARHSLRGLAHLALGLASSARATEDAGVQAEPSDVRAELKQLRDRQQQLEAEVAHLKSQGAPPAAAPATPEAPPVSLEKPAEPFAFAEYTWLNGNSRQTEFPLDAPVFSFQFMFDGNYTYSFAQPKDHSLVGSTTSGRHAEFQISHLGAGGDFHWKNVRGRIMTQFGLYSTMTVRNDPSPTRGQWGLADAYRYVSEAYAGYHLDWLHGVNIDAGIFMSYVGLCSYYDYENWVYQESYVSANTPWFFNGVRIQIHPTDTLKIEPWIINGWQSYGMYNEMPGLGWQVLWRPHVGWFSFVTNEYFGKDTLNNSNRWRFHTDTSVQVKYWDSPGSVLNRAAFSFTFDAGCEQGGGVSCAGSSTDGPAQYFVGFMVYGRFWFLHDHLGLTVGGGAISNPGRYLVLTPPINGATAASGSAYFSQSPGDQFNAWDASLTVDYMPNQFITLRGEFVHRLASVPYFSGPGGVTPDGGNQGNPGSAVEGFSPDLQKMENRMQLVLMVRI
jgi:hypothetical protein